MQRPVEETVVRRDAARRILIGRLLNCKDPRLVPVYKAERAEMDRDYTYFPSKIP